MKYLVCVALAFIGFLVFVPESPGGKIRNLPLLIAIILCIVALFLIRFLKYIILMLKTKKVLKAHGATGVKLSIDPASCKLHGCYGMIGKCGGSAFNIVFLIARRKYQRYHFEDIQHIEFYRSNRVVFQSTKIKGAVVSKQVLTNLVGKTKIKWMMPTENSETTNIVLFDKLPRQITDSVKREELFCGDRICDTNTYLYTFDAFCEYMQSTK